MSFDPVVSVGDTIYGTVATVDADGQPLTQSVAPSVTVERNGVAIASSPTVTVDVSDASLYRVSIPGVATTAGSITIVVTATCDVDGDNSDETYTARHQCRVLGGTFDVDGVADGIANRLSGVTLVVDGASISPTGDEITIDQGDDYSTRPLRIDIDTDADLSSASFVIAARPDTGGDAVAFRMTVKGDSGSGWYAEFAPTATQTETLATGTYDARFRIEWSSNAYQTIRRGRVIVRPFDTPSNVIDVDPPSS
ncbi:MAG: hypothetical protein AAF916_12225 [Planctomycetota bacterium]